MPHRSKIAAIAICLVFGPAYGEDVVGSGNFSHIVTNLDQSIAFYRDVLGLELPGGAQPFGEKPEIMRLGNTIGAQNRIAVLRVPGSALGVELIEYKDIDRKAAHPRFQDPGAANLTLRVRDIDAVMARIKSSGAKVLTAASGPVAIGTASRNVFVQDPDGFVVELAQPVPAPEVAPGASNLLGAGFETTVLDTEQTLKFYRDLLGFQLRAGDSFNNNKLMAETAGTPGARFRQSSGQIPGSTVRITFIEFKDIDRKPLHTRLQDPGTALLQLRVRDVDALVAKLKAGGAEIISAGGEPVTRGNLRLAIVRDPNNLFLELISDAKQTALAKDPGAFDPTAQEPTRRQPAPPAAPTPHLPDGRPDFGGKGAWYPGFSGNIAETKWKGVKSADRHVDVPFLRSALALFNERVETIGKDDPEAKCLPVGVPRYMFDPYPFQMIQTADRVIFIFEGDNYPWRIVPTDGRSHPKNLKPTWMGDAAGRYEGDTLVVDVVGFNGKAWLDQAGHAQTEKAHIIERYTRTDSRTLKYEVTIDDPGAYSATWTTANTVSWRPGMDLMEYVCNENEKSSVHMIGK